MHRCTNTVGPGTFVAVIHDSDRVLFTAATDTQSALIEAVAGYVAKHANDLLWPTDAARVDRLLRIGHAEAAIEDYFARVGYRWDKQWLVTTGLSASDVTTRVNGIVPRETEPALSAAG